jgi:hypothetical protein
MVSNTVTPDEVRYRNEARHAIATGKTLQIERNLNGHDFYAVIMPLYMSETKVGAIEVVQPISLVQTHISAARRHIALMAALLCLIILVVVNLVTRYSLNPRLRFFENDNRCLP